MTGLETLPRFHLFGTRKFFFFFVICSLHLSLYTAAWVTFNEAGSNWACCLLQLFLGMLRGYLSRLSLLSLSQSTSFESSLFFVFPVKGFGSSPFRKRPPARLCGRSRACVLYRLQIFSSRFDLNAMAGYFSWRRDSILRPSDLRLTT